ncbi:DUF2254 domain-containing protein [Planococcus sp. APC 3906]|uniref:DUF2254 domain-containing protein n=1 Tax=Planococcus sp. APC 3906 TaxID=3035194 RepID=UPI0025B42090|nr:DUF2254 domain-containing protein [Planococcus sp. APC 3906]MDN3450775.1 DUF2254 domain-containing protein [Planococcus sp. APC 3906]
MKSTIYLFKEKFWLTPAIFSILAIALSVGFFYVDLLLVERFKEFIPSILLTKVDLAKTIMGTLAGALLTMSTFTFSTILVVLTMYSAQFSPRALKNFVHDPVTWRVLGIFLGGFIYNTLSLLFMRDDLYTHDVLSTFVGIVIAFFCLGTFAYFIHYIATTVQVSKLIEVLIKDAEDVISYYEEFEEKCAVSEISDGLNPIGIIETVNAETSGYLQFMSFEKLLGHADKNGFEVDVLVCIGDYIYEGKPLMNIYRKEGQDYDVSGYYSIGGERSAEQDLPYALQKLVEIALRAISPGINDPNTANDIIVRIGRLLGKTAHIPHGELALANKEGQHIVKCTLPEFSGVLYKVYYQMAYYGKEDISVMHSMADSLKIVAELAPSEHHQAIWDIQTYILESLEGQQLKSMDQDFLQKKVDELAVATGQRSIQIGALAGE